jgi:2,3-bisphosphoglycerate-independent phosphoglycerate mutase
MLERLQANLKPNEVVASVTGRFWAMDRKKEWKRTLQTYNALVFGRGHKASSGLDAISQAYAKGRTDEFIEPTVVTKNGKPVTTIRNGDSIIYFNLRSDRARQLTKVFVQKHPTEFRRQRTLREVSFVAMTDFGPDLDDIVTAYPSPNLAGTLPMALHQVRQLYVAESEKFAHVTFFINGGYSDPVAGEHRIMVPSPNVANYDERPEMSSEEITKIVIDNLKADVYDFVGLNFASPDMIAHTGNLKATIKAVENVDACLGRLVEYIRARKGVLFITGDHGNAEGLLDPKTGTPDTEHSVSPVPFLVVGPGFPKARKLRPKGVLAQVAPTVLQSLGIPIPPEMTLPSLWQRHHTARSS